MDTKTLVVGQHVRMFSSGCYGCEGEVVKVTPNGVDVQTPDGNYTMDGKLLHFDANGVSYEGVFVGCGPWYIGDMPLDTKTLVVGQDVFMTSGCYLDWGKVTEVTPNGVCVQPTEEPIKPSNWNLFQYGRKSLLHFDSDVTDSKKKALVSAALGK